MTPTREIYWNISYGWLVYPLMLAVAGAAGVRLLAALASLVARRA